MILVQKELVSTKYEYAGIFKLDYYSIYITKQS